MKPCTAGSIAAPGSYGDKVGRIYAFNLIGSAAGALGIVAVLFVLVPSDALRLIATMGFIAAALVALNRRLAFWPALSAGATILALTVWVALPDAWFALRISDYKALPGALNVLGAKVLSERSGPLGLLAVVESPNVPFRYVPGLSLNAPMTPPDQLGVFFDGDSMTAITRFDGRREGLEVLRTRLAGGSSGQRDLQERQCGGQHVPSPRRTRHCRLRVTQSAIPSR